MSAKHAFAGAVLTLMSLCPLLADRVILRSGREVNGELVDQSKDEIRIRQFDSGQVETFSKKDIVRLYNESESGFRNREAETRRVLEAKETEEKAKKSEQEKPRERMRDVTPGPSDAEKKTDDSKSPVKTAEPSGTACGLSFNSYMGNPRAGSAFCIAEVLTALTLLDIKTSRLKSEIDLPTWYFLIGFSRGFSSPAAPPSRYYYRGATGTLWVKPYPTPLQDNPQMLVYTTAESGLAANYQASLNSRDAAVQSVAIAMVVDSDRKAEVRRRKQNKVNQWMGYLGAELSLDLLSAWLPRYLYGKNAAAESETRPVPSLQVRLDARWNPSYFAGVRVAF